MDYKIKRIKKHSDKRGDLVVFLKISELEDESKRFGQIYFVTFNGENMVRGNHFHKKWREWFGVMTGIIRVELEDVITKEHVSLELNSSYTYYTRLEIGPNIAHAFKNITPFASLLNYGDKEWTVNDCYPYKLILENINIE
jgi:dTDP-4-dehydrorhamnose 3,5-epimerase-like enzyme